MLIFVWIFPVFWEQDIPMELGISPMFCQKLGKNTRMKFCNDLTNTKNNYQGWHLSSFKHWKSEEVLDFEDFRNILLIFFYFLNLKCFPMEKKILFSVGNMTEYQL